MRYYFTNGDMKLRVWFNDLFPDEIEVEIGTTGNYADKKVPLVKDENGTYFVWGDTKYYMDKYDYIPVDAIYNQERYSEYDLVHTVTREGAENIVIERDVHDYFRRQEKGSKMIPCMIEGDNIFPIERGFKFHLRPVFEDDRHNYGDYHTYVSDIASLVFSKTWLIRRATEKEKEAIKAQKELDTEYEKLDSDSKYGFDREDAIERLGLKERIYR